jgi:hypothetical protein
MANITFGETLDFVHRLNYKTMQLQLLESWILLSSSGKKRWEEGQGPRDRFSARLPSFYLMTKA